MAESRVGFRVNERGVSSLTFLRILCTKPPMSHSSDNNAQLPPFTPDCQAKEIHGIESYCACHSKNSFGCPHVLRTPGGNLCWHPNWELITTKDKDFK